MIRSELIEWRRQAYALPNYALYLDAVRKLPSDQQRAAAALWTVPRSDLAIALMIIHNYETFDQTAQVTPV